MAFDIGKMAFFHRNNRKCMAFDYGEEIGDSAGFQGQRSLVFFVLI